MYLFIYVYLLLSIYYLFMYMYVYLCIMTTNYILTLHILGTNKSIIIDNKK